MASLKRPLPLPPPPPWRSPAPASGIVSKVQPPPEPSTKPKGSTMALYQGLLSVFDEMTHEQRLEFIELAYVFGQLSVDARAALVELANRLAKP